MVGTLIRRPLPPVSDFIRTLLDDADAAAARATLGFETGTYTPVATAASGAITAYTASGTYTKWGREVWVTATVSITTAGTGAGTLNITVPFTSDAGGQTIFAGQEIAATGWGCQGWIQTGFAGVNVSKYDGATIIASGRTIIISGSLRTAA